MAAAAPGGLCAVIFALLAGSAPRKMPMIRSSRFCTAVLLTAVYLLIVMSPLAPLALKSPRLAHAITGECSGDCDICGCSLERRANHTCCCWQKKLKQEQEHEEDTLPPCCKKRHGKGPVLTCNCPCGSGKLLGLWGTGTSEQLPWQFSDGFFASYEDVRFFIHPSRPTERFGDPPDPPPKLFFSV